MQSWFVEWLFHTPIELPNPVFEADFRRVRWPRTPRQLLAYYALIWLGLLALAVLLTVIDFAVFREVSLSVLLNVVLVANFGITLATDAYMLLLTLNKIGRQIETGQWEEILLTGIGAHSIFYAKYAIAQIRARKPMIAVTVCRIVPLLAFPLLLFLDIRFGYGFLAHRTAMTILTNGPAIIVVLMTLPGVFLYLWALEPVWQMQTITAVGIVFPLRARDMLLSLLAGFTAILALRLVQMILWAVIIIAFLFVSQIVDARQFLCIAPFFIIGTPLSLWLFHAVIRNYTQDRALKLINRR